MRKVSFYDGDLAFPSTSPLVGKAGKESALILAAALTVFERIKEEGGLYAYKKTPSPPPIL